ncbi:MAG: MerC domain-containing protein [Pseudomonadota bacterium]
MTEDVASSGSTSGIDGAATGLSIACIIHCLILPIFAATSPFIAALAENEMVHIVVAILAVLASGSIIAMSPSARTPGFLVPACAGMALIVGALFLEEFGVDETIPTVIGGLLIAFAHGRRLFAK